MTTNASESRTDLCRPVAAIALALAAAAPAAARDIPGPGVAVCDDPNAGALTVKIAGRAAMGYQYGPAWDLTHYWPLNSPSGKNMLVQKTKPYPHHRCFWFADTIALGDSKPVSFYNGYYSGKKDANGGHGAPFANRIRHVRFNEIKPGGRQAVIKETLVWQAGETRMLDERRLVRIVDLGGGQYLMDVTFTVTAGYGDVTFRSDSVHYAWPYLRMNKTFNGDSGGVITTDTGKTGQKATSMTTPFVWVDYSKKFDAGAEGLAVFSHPDNDHPHTWLTREYGTFGPRRPDDKSGKRFVLKKDEKMSQRIGVYVHRGDVKQADVAGMYKKWAGGNL